jgi:alanine racemase
VGSVCMDFFMVSLKNRPDVVVGDPVTVFENSGDIARLSEHCKTIPYELIARLGPRIHRIMQPPRASAILQESECELLL